MNAAAFNVYKTLRMKVRQSSRRVIQELGFLDNLFSEIGSYSQCHALYELKRSKYLSGSELSKLLNLEKSSVSRLIKSLESKGYCKNEQDPKDSRTRLVTLTKKGEEDVRGLGLGSMLLKYLLMKATENGYKQMYLETMDFMHRANTLYINNGFILLKKPKFNTGHVWTNHWHLNLFNIYQQYPGCYGHQ